MPAGGTYGLGNKIKPDFSSRGTVEPVAVTSEPPRTQYPAKEAPVGDGKPHDYNKPAELPDWASNVKKASVPEQAPMRMSAPFASVQPVAPSSSFSPHLETFPTIGTSYFSGGGGRGDTGVQGAQGYTGATGATGTHGVAGATGAQGSQGYTGSQGFTGQTGAQGYTGYTGAQGYTGQTGAQGDTGAQGKAGAVSDTGAQGAQGYTGPAGTGGVDTLNGLVGDVFLVGTATITISPSVPGASDIQIDAPGLGVSTDVGTTTAWGTANTALANANTAQGTANAAGAAAAAAQFTADAASGAAAAANVIATGAAATAATALAQSGVTSVNSGTGAITVQAGTGGITVGTSGSVITINGSAGGVPTQIADGGASVACDSVGAITAVTNLGQSMSLISDAGFKQVTNNGTTTIQNTTSVTSRFHIDAPGNIYLDAGDNAHILMDQGSGAITFNTAMNVDITGEILTFPQVAGANAGQIVGLSTLNSAPYSAFIQQGQPASLSSLTVTSGDGIIAPLAVLTEALIPTLSGAGYASDSYIYNYSTITSLNMSTTNMYLSTINGAAYPPIGSTGATGATGPVGTTGATGPVGTTGATGATGFTGTTGATGAASATGATGATGPSVSWISGGTYSTVSVTISTTNTLVGYTSSISTTTTGKYLVHGSFTGTQVNAGTNQLAMSIGRTLVSNGVPSNNANTINLANGSGMQNNVGGSTSSKMMATSIVNTAQTGVQASVIDTPGGVGPYYYSIWAAGSVSNDLTSENIMLSVLQVLP